MSALKYHLRYTKRDGHHKSLRGTRDLLPPETELWNRVEATARAVFARYAFGEIRTPLFEATELFARGVGEETESSQKRCTPGRIAAAPTAGAIKAGANPSPSVREHRWRSPLLHRAPPRRDRHAAKTLLHRATVPP